MGKISKDKRDIYYRLAKQNGYRSRSAYKLLQIIEHFDIFNPEKHIKNVLDLCAAPGGWSEVCSQKLVNIPDSKIIAVDLQEIAEIPGVDIIKGDITNYDTYLNIIQMADNKPIDLTICDGAPDVTGLNEFDCYVQNQLILNALNLSIRLLKQGGCFISKFFRGKYAIKTMKILLCCFDKITITKPRACRNASFESFLFCQGFNLKNKIIEKLHNNKMSEDDILILNTLDVTKEDSNNEKLMKDNDMNINDDFSYEKYGVKTIQVGTDNFDSDKSYDLSYTNYNKVLDPKQKPINPPYKKYINQ